MEWMWMWIWAAFWLLVPVLLIVAVVLLLVRRRSPEPRRSSALRILEERYARGEIDRDEYLERKSILEEAR
jgi:putative membrane protein